MAHAKLSPSAAHRWLNCPGSITLCSTLPPARGSVYADEGAAAHYLAERSLLKGAPASAMLGATINAGDPVRKFKVTPEMVENVQIYLDAVARAKGSLVNPVCEVEARLDLSHWIPGGFGTGDHVAVEPLGTLVIQDLKYGAGVPVDVWTPEEGINTQLGIYALGAVGAGNPNGVERVRISVVQPRAPHPDGPERSHEMDIEELLQWGEDVIRPGAKLALEEDAPKKSGSWCRWCAAFSVCPQARRDALAAASIMFPDEEDLPTEKVIRVPPASSLSPDQMARIYALASNLLEPWIKEVKGRFQEFLAANGPTGGYKLVAGRATRKWGNPDEVKEAAVSLVGLQAYEPATLKSPAQMEKTLKQAGQDPKALAHLVVESRGVSIARLDDNRPALPAGVDTMFEIEEN